MDLHLGAEKLENHDVKCLSCFTVSRNTAQEIVVAWPFEGDRVRATGEGRYWGGSVARLKILEGHLLHVMKLVVVLEYDCVSNMEVLGRSPLVVIDVAQCSPSSGVTNFVNSTKRHANKCCHQQES